jgi:molecular chaperone DnaK
MGAVIGIDLGTTNSLVAHFAEGRPSVLPTSRGARSTPSVVALDPEGRLVAGEAARAQLIAQPGRSIAEVKRLMGSDARVTLGERTYAPTEISAHILRTLRDDAQRALGADVDEAVITVPAYFTDAQRQATKDAGEIAGLRVERILNEPTAAALAYGIDHLDKEAVVVVYDLGGGTFDVSVLEMFNGVLDVKASAGNNRLGGGDFDRALVKWLRAAFEHQHGLSIEGDLQAQARLLDAAERAKVELSSSTTTVVSLPFLAMKSGKPRSLEIELTRKTFESLVAGLVRSTLEPLLQALGDAKVGKSAVAEILLVGGSSRMPLVREMLRETFGKEAREGVNPDEAVALGAAVQAALKTGAISQSTGIMITDVAPFTLGVETQARAGSQVVHGMFAPLIPRNTTIPVSRTETFQTTSDGQTAVDVRVFQGESRFTKHNVYLDQLHVDGVPRAPQGREQIAITFTYDINGILHVTTKIVSTGKDAKLVIDKSARRMSDAERGAARERLARERGDAASAHRTSSATPPEHPLQALLLVARKRAAELTGSSRVQLDALLVEGEQALARGDVARANAVDVALTDVLFTLG